MELVQKQIRRRTHSHTHAIFLTLLSCYHGLSLSLIPTLMYLHIPIHIRHAHNFLFMYGVRYSIRICVIDICICTIDMFSIRRKTWNEYTPFFFYPELYLLAILVNGKDLTDFQSIKKLMNLLMYATGKSQLS